MLYLMALQELNRCPFRVVDEINQVGRTQSGKTSVCLSICLSIYRVAQSIHTEFARLMKFEALFYTKELLTGVTAAQVEDTKCLVKNQQL